MGIRACHRRQFEKEIILSKHAPEGQFKLVFILDHMKATFNVGKIIRSANAFGARSVHLIGMRQFNPRPAKGTLKYTRTYLHDTFESSYQQLAKENYTFYAMDPHAAQTIGAGCRLPEKTAIIIGHEENGFSFTFDQYRAVKKIRIPQFGVVESLNASIAASVAAYEYLRQRSGPDLPLLPLPSNEIAWSF